MRHARTTRVEFPAKLQRRRTSMNIPTKQGTDSDTALAAGIAGKDPAADRGQSEAAAAAELLQVLALSEADVRADRVRPLAEAVARLRGKLCNAR